MGKNKLKQQLKRQQRDVLRSTSTGDSAASGNPNKKQKTQKSTGENETEVEIDTLNFDDAFSAGLAFEQLESHDGALATMDQQLKATEVYKKSLEINSEALESMKDGDEDAAELTKAYGITLAALADAFGELGDIDSAVKVFEDAAMKFPENANMHYNVANMRMAKNGSSGNEAFDSEVAKSLERAFKLSPDTRDFVQDLAAYLEQHDQQADLVRELKEKAEKLPSAQNESDNEGEDVEEKDASSGSDEDEEESEEE
eukprot:jgi/Phyca11/14185/fgenesh1_pg.PHYCAscaffold_6_\